MRNQIKISCHGCGQKLDVSEVAAFARIQCPSCEVELIVPKPFGNLLLEEELSSSSLATIFRAMDMTLDREICVKVLAPRYAADNQLAKLFINEASMASAINHPNVVPIYSCGEVEDQPYIVMQFMSGGSLEARLLADPKRRLPQRQTCEWILEAVKGMECAYAQGIVHHDIRPTNILFDGDGNVKVSDFGLVQLLLSGKSLIGEGADPTLPISKDMAAFFSPEKITTGREDFRGDIYSLGAAMYYLLTGDLPFTGPDPHAIMAARFEDRSGPDLRAARPELAPALVQLTECMMAEFPRQRPSSYADLRQSLSKLLDELPETDPDPAPAAEAGPATRTRQRSQLPRGQTSTINMKRPPRPRAKAAADGGAAVDKETADRIRNARDQQSDVLAPRNRFGGWWRLIPLLLIAAILVLFYCLALDPHWAWYQDQVKPILKP